MSSKGSAQHFDDAGFAVFLENEAGRSLVANLAGELEKVSSAQTWMGELKGESFLPNQVEAFFDYAADQHNLLQKLYHDLVRTKRSALERLVSAHRFTPLRVQEPMPSDARPLWDLNGPICSCGVNSPRRVFELTRTQASAYFAQSLDLLRRDLKAVATLMSEWTALAEEAAATIDCLTIEGVPARA
jgi:hypothetical protein